MEWIRRETIGHGSFSTVSLATTSGSSTTTLFPPLIAVKSSGVVCSAALMNERYVLDYLGDSSEIVRCFGEGKTVENGEEVYNLFLEYASGGNLADRIKNSGEGLPEFEVRRFTRSIVKGLCHIHKNGFSHCDLKLENVLVFDDGYDHVKISDFGLAKRTRSSEEVVGGAEIRGTPLYMAPECVNHGEFESPADIWALGCSVVEMSSGKTAWCLDEGDMMGSNNNVMSLMVRIGSGDEVPRIPVELSEEGKDFVSKCFVKDAAERWTAQMLLDHPFLAVDDGHESGGSYLSLRCGEEDEASVSPRNPFDFPGWNSVHSPVNESVRFSSLVRSPEERISGLVSEMIVVPDWSVSCDWVNVR
ncbi:PREDICTED: mitogen-activated protein kinase kinase kinase NPK1-like [Camelina sativa]|uniref:Mitogen-activated protein kinase kinase kinase NPK1-like n=1 Tax=Camelina sativa TaxID=90675 RepID=A0ABM0U7U8_CAMSA|nr:PREDICTED: mitogen-activated protein kinase kinase kinase NPK1-like [Camelina sativa]